MTFKRDLRRAPRATAKGMDRLFDGTYIKQGVNELKKVVKQVENQSKKVAQQTAKGVNKSTRSVNRTAKGVNKSLNKAVVVATPYANSVVGGVAGVANPGAIRIAIPATQFAKQGGNAIKKATQSVAKKARAMFV